MGTVFRFYFCAGCGKRYRSKVVECGCGSTTLEPSEAWYIRYRSQGRSVEEKVGSKILAREVLKDREREVEEGAFRLQRERKITVAAFVSEHYQPLYVEKKRSARTFKANLKNHILPQFGGALLQNVSQVDIEGWIARLDTRLTVATVNRLLSLLKSIYRRAVEWKFVKYNPAAGVRVRRENNKIVRYLEAEQYAAMIEAADDQMKAALALAVGTMLRRENLFGLSWKQVDLRARTIRITGDMMKGGADIVLPIIDPVYDVLASLPRALNNDYVLINPDTGTRYSQGMRKQFERIKRAANKAIAKNNRERKKAGLKEMPLIDLAFRWHDLRHTGASWLAMAGVDLVVIQALLGHKDIQTTQRYAHLSPDYKREQAGRMAQFFISEPGNKGTSKQGGVDER